MQNGFSLIEVLIALIIFSVSLLGFANGEIKALRQVKNTYQQTVNQLQTISLAEQRIINNEKK